MRRERIAVGPHCVSYAIAGGGEPLVLVHGLAGSGRWWSRNVAALAAGRRVFVVDLPGFGDSTAGVPFSPVDAPRFLLAWADRVGIGCAAWAGHSMGGRAVAELAADAPERVSRLVLVDAPVFPAGPDWPVSMRGLLLTLRHAAPSLLPVVAEDVLRTGPLSTTRSARDVLATGIGGRLQAIEAPTLLVWGENDRLVPPNVGRRIAARIPDARFVVIPGGDHAPMWGRADLFNEVVSDFLG